MRQRLNDHLLYAGWSAVAVVMTFYGFRELGGHLNLSPSVPRGIYALSHEPLERGRYVLFCLPPEAAQFGVERGYLKTAMIPFLQDCVDGTQALLKPIAAHGGDMIEMDTDSVSINGARMPHSATLGHDSAGRPLTHMPWGRYHLLPGQLWVMSSHRDNSWDSRYFGPVHESQVIATADPVLVEK